MWKNFNQTNNLKIIIWINIRNKWEIVKKMSNNNLKILSRKR
jgi:hypothetical protein